MAKTAANKAVSPAPSRAPWSITQWNGDTDNYQCGLCDYAHLEKARLESHVKSRHSMTLADAPSEAPSS